MKGRVLIKHSNPKGPHDWWADGTTRWLDANGTRRGHDHHWLVVRCNDTECPAEALLDSFDVGALVAELEETR